MQPGEFFTHRNIANIVHHTDINCLAVIQYAIEVLQVKHIIICGHYGCGGVKAAMENKESGLIDHWLRSVKDLYIANKPKIDNITDYDERVNFLCEANVCQQVTNICHNSFVQNAWNNNKKLTVHGWVYDISNSKLKDLNVCYSAAEQVPDIYRIAP
jgi:carbonic anhydrase